VFVFILSISRLLRDDQVGKNLLSQTIASQLTTHGRRMGITQDLRFVLIVDEAHHISPNLRNYLSVLERYALELRKYGMGLVVIATRPTLINEAKNPNPVKFRAIAPPDLLLNPPRAVPPTRNISEPRAKPIPTTEQTVTAPIPIVTKDDSAWAIYQTLPSWARDAASRATERHGAIPARALEDSGLSRSQIKSMVHGTSRLFTEDGRFLRLTTRIQDRHHLPTDDWLTANLDTWTPSSDPSVRIAVLGDGTSSLAIHKL
jgi:hypothetical protein